MHLLIYVKVIFRNGRANYENMTNALYADGDAIQLNNLYSGLSLFRQMALYSFGNKKLEDIENVYQASLIYKLLSDNEEDMMMCHLRKK